MTRILVIDGNTAETRKQQRAVGGSDSGDAYARTLGELASELGASVNCDIVRPADETMQGSLTSALASYAGATITGSALNVYHDQPPVNRQVDLARAVLEAGIPLFGSCWGLQVAAVAAGGRVVPNPLGREFGFARRIELTTAGRAHSMFRDKVPVFEAITVHRDCVVELPAGSVELARNDMGLQAAEIRYGRAVCWGVQYHPEYTLREIAATARRYGPNLIQDGLFGDAAEIERFAAELTILEDNPQHRSIAWRHGLGAGVLDIQQRLAELRNWLRHIVLKR